MRLARTRLVLLPMLLLSPAALVAQSPVIAAGCHDGALADADINSIVSARWDPGSTATLRIVSLHQGFEHVSSRVVAQWLAPDENDRPQVQSSVELVPAGMLSLRPPTVVADGGVVRIELEGVHTYQHDLAVRCSFELSADGTVRTLRPCGG